MEESKYKAIFLTIIILVVLVIGLIIYSFYLNNKLNECNKKCTENNTTEKENNIKEDSVLNKEENNITNDNSMINNIDNTNTNSNINNNTQNENKKTSLEISNELWKNTFNLYWNVIDNIKIGQYDEKINKYPITNYDGIADQNMTNNAITELENYWGITKENNNYYISFPKRVKDDTYIDSKLTIIKETDAEIISTVTNEYCAKGTKTNCSDIAKLQTEFKIILENGTYKVYSFILPN